MTASARDAAAPVPLTSSEERPGATRPALDSRPAKAAQVWAEMEALAAEISEHWPAEVPVVEAVQEQRREP